MADRKAILLYKTNRMLKNCGYFWLNFTEKGLHNHFLCYFCRANLHGNLLRIIRLLESGVQICTRRKMSRALPEKPPPLGDRDRHDWASSVPAWVRTTFTRRKGARIWATGNISNRVVTQCVLLFDFPLR